MDIFNPNEQNPSYWEGVYRSLGPDDVFEWGGISCPDLLDYQYRLVSHSGVTVAKEAGDENAGQAKQALTTTLGETLGAEPYMTEEQPIMLLGCGNSKFGEDMADAGWKGPLLQVDISSRVVDSVRQRCSNRYSKEQMTFVQDDATVLSAFQDATVQAVLDKGLVDALFCGDAHDQCLEVMSAVHRVLLPEAYYCVLSFSRPEFILDKLLTNNKRRHSMWSDVQIRALDNILLYRFQKSRTVEKSRSSRRRRP